MEKKSKHNFTHTHVDIHDDGSMTIHHVHGGGADKDVHHAVADLDGLHDSLQKHLNPDEVEGKVEAAGKDPEEMEEAIHPGIHEKVLEMAKE